MTWVVEVTPLLLWSATALNVFHKCILYHLKANYFSAFPCSIRRLFQILPLLKVSNPPFFEPKPTHGELIPISSCAKVLLWHQLFFSLLLFFCPSVLIESSHVSFQPSVCKLVHRLTQWKLENGREEGHFTSEIQIVLSLDILWAYSLF